MFRQTMAWLARHLRGRYVLLPEEMTARLRAENRALVNSLLGTAGFPPISMIARERELAAGKSAPEK